MLTPKPRGIAVVDVGYTNSKISLFSPQGMMVAERRVTSRHLEGPPYCHIDPEPMVALCREALPALDRILPIDVIVPCAHGAAMACVDASGGLALPVMDYISQPPPGIVADYRRIAPGFAETTCTLLPMTLTHGLQLYWQSQAFPQEFARVKTLMTWIQYVGFRLSGAAVTEISSLSCQTHLMDTRQQVLSSLVRGQGWAPLFPRMAKAWETIGQLKPEFCGSGFRGEGRVLAGVHDSTANFMRYVCAGLDRFTLVSTGTWSIAFDPSTALDQLVESRDTNTNTDVLGRTVACSRFFGGKEFEIVSGGVPAEMANIDAVKQLVARGTRVLPSMTDSGGPVPAKGGRGRIEGPLPADECEQVSLAALYCAQMVSEQLDAIASRHDIIVDGPFSQNAVLLQVLAQLRPGQRVLASDLRDGTTAGAATIALIDEGQLPIIGLELTEIPAAEIAGLATYHASWKESAYETTDEGALLQLGRVKMFDHIGFSTPDLERSRAFYTAALVPLGIRCLFEVTPEMTGSDDAFLGYGKERPQFWIGTGKLHQPRIHIAFTADDRATVDAFYRAAIAAGGRDNGPPGLRPQYHADYYGAFVLDPDGHNIEAVCHAAAVA